MTRKTKEQGSEIQSLGLLFVAAFLLILDIGLWALAYKTYQPIASNPVYEQVEGRVKTLKKLPGKHAIGIVVVLHEREGEFLFRASHSLGQELLDKSERRLIRFFIRSDFSSTTHKPYGLWVNETEYISLANSESEDTRNFIFCLVGALAVFCIALLIGNLGRTGLRDASKLAG